MRSGWDFVEVVLMVPHRCPIPVGGRVGEHVSRSPQSRGGRWSIAAVLVIRVSWGSAPWPVARQGIGKVKASGLPGCLVRAVQRE